MDANEHESKTLIEPFLQKETKKTKEIKIWKGNALFPLLPSVQEIFVSIRVHSWLDPS